MLWELPTTVLSVANPVTCHATTLARPLTRADLATGDRASWEPGLSAAPTVDIWEGLPGDEATAMP
jgi:hypothetical protein